MVKASSHSNPGGSGAFDKEPTMLHRPTRTSAPRRSTLRKLLLACCVALTSIGAIASIAPAASASTSLGDVWVVAAGTYDCTNQQIDIVATTDEPLSVYTVYSYAQVYDFNLGRWISSSQWAPVDGITPEIFYGITNPYTYAKVTYARIVNGTWTYSSDWITLKDDLANSTTFCKAGW
jgi:hypothetical protein